MLEENIDIADIIEDGKYDDILFEDSALMYVDQDIDESVDAENDLLSGSFTDSDLVDLVMEDE